MRGASSLATRSSSDDAPVAPWPSASLTCVLVEVERDDLVVGVAVDAMDHVAAHLPEADEAELHQMLPLRSCDGPGEVAGRQAHADGLEPVVAQGLQVAVGLRVDQRAERRTARPGSSASASASCTSWRKRPTGGPPLWNWPVECRKRGP